MARRGTYNKGMADSFLRPLTLYECGVRRRRLFFCRVGDAKVFLISFISFQEWSEVWTAMRDVGDESASKLLGALLIKDRFDSSRVGLDGVNSDGWNLLHKAALHNCPECGLRLLAAAVKVSTESPPGTSGAAQGLDFLERGTKNGSTALEVVKGHRVPLLPLRLIFKSGLVGHPETVLPPSCSLRGPRVAGCAAMARIVL